MLNQTNLARRGCHSVGACLRSIAVPVGAVIALIGLAAAAGGCSSAAPPAASSSPSPSASPSATAVSQPTASPGTATVPASASPSATPAAVPALGQLAGDFAHGQGFGQVKPGKIFNGGDPTGLVTNVVWSSWGGAQATATGTAEYVGPNQSVAQGTEESATVVAFDLGSCAGKYMYQAVEWYFPQHKQSFNPNTYENICTGSYDGTP
jgi:pyruvate/2-oxoglutarate dehydrogenase complex dihydrolipoamide acyltransferase (E2) component